MSRSFDSRVRALMGENDSGLTDRLGDILIEVHARAMVVASEFGSGRERDAWVRFARRMKEYAEVTIDLPQPAESCAHESVTTADGNGAYCRKCGETTA